jgi:hypothetical protein
MHRHDPVADGEAERGHALGRAPTVVIRKQPEDERRSAPASFVGPIAGR